MYPHPFLSRFGYLCFHSGCVLQLFRVWRKQQSRCIVGLHRTEWQGETRQCLLQPSEVLDRSSYNLVVATLVVIVQSGCALLPFFFFFFFFCNAVFQCSFSSLCASMSLFVYVLYSVVYTSIYNTAFTAAECFVCWLLNVPVTCECISGTVL